MAFYVYAYAQKAIICSSVR